MGSKIGIDSVTKMQADVLGGCEMVKQSNDGESGKKRGFMRLQQVLEILPISKSTWWKGIRDGKFPKQIKISERTSAWSRQEIDDLCHQFVVKATSESEKQLP